MADLSRFTQKIFASTAAANNLAQFGSFAAGAPAEYDGTTITPALVQALSNYLTGWFGAIVGNNSPLIQDMNALCYLFAYQLTYLLQKGIPDWDSGTTYYTGDIVKSGSIIYVSIADSNTNHSVSASNNAYWTTLANGGQPVPVATQASITVSSGKSLMVPFPTISAGDTYTINSGAYFVGVQTMTVNGTFVVNGTAKIIP
jgi:hypothetical protein